MYIAATIQARMGSSRLPGKVLKEINGKPLLLYQIERIRSSILIDDVIISTSTSRSDDILEELAVKYNVKCYRGSENDVLQRIVDTLKHFKVDVNVEFMGDNPIPDPNLVDTIIGFYLKHKDKYDYITNALKTTYPPGFEVFVYPSQTLYDAEKETKYSDLREHVGLHIYKRPDRFRIFNIEAPESIRRYIDYHFEVDTTEDFEVMDAIIRHFMPQNPNFSMMQAIEYMENNPHLIEINTNIHRRWEIFRKDND